MKVCAEPGCPTLTRTSRCPTHERAKQQARGSREARGYDWAHRQLRQEWATRIASGTVRCANPDCRRLIHPDEPWDLGHTEDRTQHRGPEHQACNRSDGGKAAHQPHRGRGDPPRPPNHLHR